MKEKEELCCSGVVAAALEQRPGVAATLRLEEAAAQQELELWISAAQEPVAAQDKGSAAV